MVGSSGDDVVIQRDKSPGPYWFTMTLHVLIAVVASLLSAAATWRP